MPSIDEDLLLALYESGKLLVLAEQNNGYILQNLLKVLYRRGKAAAAASARIMAINTLDADGRPRFIHSGHLRGADRRLRAVGAADRGVDRSAAWSDEP